MTVTGWWQGTPCPHILQHCPCGDGRAWGQWVLVGIPVRPAPALTWERVAQEWVHGVPREWDLSCEGEQEVVTWRGLAWRG